MQVETYEVEELTGEAANMAADYESSELIASLGLVGQTKLLNTETVTRQPYRLVSKEEQAVFGTCFPKQTKLEDYSQGIIPLRILQLVAHAKETGLFYGFVVWHPEPGMTDPVLVGLTKTQRESSTYKWEETNTYLLARWGDALLPFNELRVKAREILLARWKAGMVKAKREIEMRAGCLEEMADDMLMGGEQHTGTPSFHF